MDCVVCQSAVIPQITCENIHVCTVCVHVFSCSNSYYVLHWRYRSHLHRGSLAEDVLVSELEKKPLSQLALNTKLPTPTEENAELAQKKDSPTMNESPKV